MNEFLRHKPTLEDQWRAIVLFGRNVASYKFALAKSLIELSSSRKDLIRLEELSVPFAKHICEHLALEDKQATSPSSKMLEACRDFNSGEIDKSILHQRTEKLGFVNVIDAFHIVGSGETPVRFFLDERNESKGIRLTDSFFRLFGSTQSQNLPPEVEARWRLVETAWAMNISHNLLSVEYGSNDKMLWVVSSKRRKAITSCRDALDGYQKAKCFYCFREISIVSGSEHLADVDHFIPHSFQDRLPTVPINGMWNLVLACKDCNRGVGGKSARLPSPILFERLQRRNEYLIDSHHPLRETLILQTGKTKESRDNFLESTRTEASKYSYDHWEPQAKGPAEF